MRWCQKSEDGGFEIGVMFTDAEAISRMRIIEQLCCIMEYLLASTESGREISFEQATQEWMSRDTIEPE